MKTSVLKTYLTVLLALTGATSAFAGAEQDFETAYRAGKLLTAEAAYLKIVKSNSKVAPLVHFQAAEIARNRCQGLQERDRLALFLRQEKGWTPEVENALWILVATGDNIEHFRRLAAHVPASDPFLVRDGFVMFQRFLNARRFSPAFQMGGALLEAFGKDRQKANLVFNRLNALCDGNRKAALPEDEIRAFLEKYAYPDCRGWQLLVSGYGFTDADWVIDQTARLQRTISDQTWKAVASIDNTRYADAKTPASEKTAIEIRAHKIQKAKDVFFSLDFPIAALYCSVALNNPQLFFKDRTPKALSSASARLFNEALKLPVPRFQKTACENRQRELFMRFADLWTPQTLIAFLEKHPQIVPADQLCKKFPKQADEIRRVCKPVPAPKENAALKSSDPAVLIDLFRRTSAKDKSLPGVFARTVEVLVRSKTVTEAQCLAFVKDAVSKIDGEYPADERSTFSAIVGKSGSAGLSAYRHYLQDVRGQKDVFSGIRLPRNGEMPPADIDQAKMTPSGSRVYVSPFNYDSLKPAGRLKLLADCVNARPFTEHIEDGNFVNWVLDRLCSLAEDPSLARELPLKKLCTDIYAAVPTSLDWADRVPALLRLGRTAKRFDEVYQPFFAMAEKADPSLRAYLYATVVQAGMGRGWLINDDEAYGSFLSDRIVPALKAIPVRQATKASLNFQTLLTARLRSLRNEKTMAALGVFHAEIRRLYFNGLPRISAPYAEGALFASACEAALAANDEVLLGRLAGWTSRSVGDEMGQSRFTKLVEAVQKKGYDEALFLLVSALPDDCNAGYHTIANKVRVATSGKVQGVYPVDEKDPSYPLYVASDELARQNPERAWKILQEKNNLTIFEREAINLPTPFVIWAVDQLRISRGEKDALLQKAKQIATYLLSQESKISVDLAAAMILIRAECFRDQQNFEAAKLEYQSIRDNPNYQRTPSGRKAMFRAVDLQIAIGNAQGQESILEYWLSQPDKEVQAEAHYFMAKIAFDRKDYDECDKQLKLVFQLDFTHTEGRFLEGQWKLATNREVDETEVIVGSIGDRTIIRPGQQLSITVNDANLSVAGGGASIPIVLTTEPGGDVEYLQLFPGTRDPSEFKGAIGVELGKAVVSNRSLQVTGADTVSYEINPDYLKLRGLPLNTPKRLKVVDDAKMAIGAGAPKVASEKSSAEVVAALDGGAGGGRSLRPGNPIYVAVQDRDRSLGGEADTVRVDVKTTSGDRLEGVELVEEKPFTGIFRAKIDTALPPPRAYASDTAAGMNAGDAINSTRTTPWKSVADGKPGKWFAVDTMGSYLMSNVTLKTSSVGDIKAIRLKGSIAGREYDLASLPARKIEQVTGLRMQRSLGKFSHDPKAIRAFFQTESAPRPETLTNLSYSVLNPRVRDAQAGYCSGVFRMEEGYDNLRLRIVAQKTKGRTFGNLWVSLMVDGVEFLSGQGEALHNHAASIDLEPGCHRFEMFALASAADDAFTVLWEPYGEDARQLPVTWFDAAKNPEIIEYLKEPATIIAKKDGFVAQFQKPLRLRTLRWEFADVKSPSISVEEMSVVDLEGQQVLPVTSDFSDAQHNDTLEVAPGDSIVVQYVDELTPRGQKRVLERSMSSSFNNGSVSFTYEVPSGNRLRSCKAYRFQPGDSLVMNVNDADCDLTDEADKVKVRIVTSRGEVFDKLLLEVKGGGEESAGVHTGVFKGLLRTCEVGNTNAPASVMRVLPTDRLKVVYLDRENTSPGVPTELSDEVQGVRKTTPALKLFHTRDRLEPDTSAAAAEALERIRRRPGNENVSVVYRTVIEGEAMTKEESETTNEIPVNIAAPIPFSVTDPSRARHSGSVIRADVVAQSELDAAAAEGREADRRSLLLTIGGGMGLPNLKGACLNEREAIRSGSFNGFVPLALGSDDAATMPGSKVKPLVVSGSDTVVLRIFDENDEPIMERHLKLVSNASMGLTDSTFDAERDLVHVGERFFLKVVDPDRDATDEADRFEVRATSTTSGVSRKVILTETMPHSGVFTGGLRPVMFAPGEAVPSVATGGVVTVTEALADDRFAVKYGDQVIFTYEDKTTLPGTEMPRTLAATGSVFRGANGSVRMFSKRFRDRDTAVLVQFRLAECLFEQAKDFRKLKKPEKSAEAIAEGKFILEEALKNYPDSAHVVQGEFLLANLYQELGMEQKEAAKDDPAAEEKARPLFTEALSRFSQILSTWPDGEFAARSQYHKAFCLEQLEEYARASEEYVKMTYLFPESELVGEATIRLATYYYTKEKKYSVSGHIYQNFQQRFPQHAKAARALFMAGSCYIKQAETVSAEIAKAKAEAEAAGKTKANKREKPGTGSGLSVTDLYRSAVETFNRLAEEYRDSAPPELKAQALYWAGDVSCRIRDYTKAYQYLKRTTFEYPDTEWARRARGLLLQEGNAFKGFE